MFAIKELRTRGISADTAQHYGIKVSMNSTTGEVDTHYFPYYIKKELAGYKVRRLPKQFLQDVGSIKGVSIKGVDPFGWHLIKPGKKLIITEGEYDACILHQALTMHSQKTGYNVPSVVSLANGAQVGNLIESKFKQLDKYDEIILCFDDDGAGRKAVQDFSMAYNPEKVKVMTLTHKDANEAYLEDGPEALIEAFYSAKALELGGMVSLRDCFDLAYEGEDQGLSYPWPIMTKHSGGNRAPEIMILMSGSGAGKTDVVTEIIRHFALEHKLDVSFYSLEMSLKKSSQRLIGKQVLRRKLADSTPKQIEEDKLSSAELLDRVKFYDMKQGLLNADHLIYLMRQQAVLHKTKVHVIDNLTQLTSGDKNEKATIDKFIKDLKDLAERYELRVFLVVHLNRGGNGSVGFESGARIGPEHLYGSGGPAKWADTVLALERNQYHTDEDTRNVTICRWLKDRESGESTGKIFALKYDHETGGLSPTEPVNIIESEDGTQEF
jgi:twinkle protein